MIPEKDIINDRLKAKSRMTLQDRINLQDNEIRVSFFDDVNASIFINWIGTKQEAEHLRSQILQDAKNAIYYKKLSESIAKDRDVAFEDTKIVDEIRKEFEPILRSIWFYEQNSMAHTECYNFYKKLQSILEEK